MPQFQHATFSTFVSNKGKKGIFAFQDWECMLISESGFFNPDLNIEKNIFLNGDLALLKEKLWLTDWKV